MPPTPAQAHHDQAAARTANDSGPEAATVPPTSGIASAAGFLAPPQAADEIGRLAHYRVLRQLGMGGMGMVFLAEDSVLQRQVALKLMLPALAADAINRERFLREARAAAALSHDHIVTIHQVGEERGVPFLAMQLLQGETLEDYLKRGKKIGYMQTCRIGREAANGLAAAHAHGMVHRDIKPANLWLEAPKGRVKILDFGLARSSTDINLTGSGAILGTPAYMSPEQARSGQLDGRADLWSLGVVLYRLTTGRLPFQGPDMLATISAIALDTPAAPIELAHDVPPEVSALIVQMLAKNRDDRPASARVVADRLLQIERSLRPNATAANPAQIPLPRTLPMPIGEEPDRETRPSLAAGRQHRAARREAVAGPPAQRSRAALLITIGFAAFGLLSAAAWSLFSHRSYKAPDTRIVSTAPPVTTTAAKSESVVKPTDPLKIDWFRGERGFRIKAVDGQIGPVFVGSNRASGMLVIVDAEHVWQRPAAGGSWTTQPYAAELGHVYSGVPRHVALSTDGAYLAVCMNATAAGNRNHIVLWDLKNGRAGLRQTTPAGGPTTSLSFAAGGRFLASTAFNKVHYWEVKEGAQLQFVAQSEPFNAVTVACSPSQAVAAVGTRRGELVLLEPSSFANRWMQTVGRGPVQSIAWSSDGRRIVVACENITVVLDADSGKTVTRLPIAAHSPMFSPDHRWIGGLGADNVYRLYDSATGRVVAASSADGSTDALAAAFNLNGRFLMILSRDGALRHWELPAELTDAR